MVVAEGVSEARRRLWEEDEEKYTYRSGEWA
jgi:hypothetical protein